MVNNLKNIIRSIICFFLIGFLSQCQKEVSTLAPAAYSEWVNEPNNNLQKEKQISDYVFEVKYQPIEYLALKELRKEMPLEQIGISELEKKQKELEGLQYFVFKISRQDGVGDLMESNISSANEYYQRVEYFSVHGEKDIQLIDGKDTLAPVLYHFERSYGMAPYANIVLAFENKGSQKQDKTLVWHDQVFGVGIIKLTIEGKDISNIPKLKLSTHEVAQASL